MSKTYTASGAITAVIGTLGVGPERNATMRIKALRLAEDLIREHLEELQKKPKTWENIIPRRKEYGRLIQDMRSELEATQNVRT